MIWAILILMKIRYQQTKNLDKSEDNNKKDDKQTQTSKITHQQTISSLVER